MRCISPLLIRKDGRRDTVPCGKCNFCLEQKRASWSFRLGQELKQANTAKFLTFTYAPDYLPLNPETSLPEVSKFDVQSFTKRLRKANAEETDWKLRYYTCAEYGTETSRPHYHSIMFNLHPTVMTKLSDIWGKGICHIGEVEPASIHYVTKYVINRHGDNPGREPPFALMSRRPGLGVNYVDTHKSWHVQGMRNYTKVNGQLGTLPRYYKEKIFTSLQRQKLAGNAISEADRIYHEEISRLAKFCSDPYAYYDSREQHAHDSVHSKINSTNTL